MQPIGRVVTTATEPVDEQWGSVVSEIHIEEALAAGLRGLDQFTHVLVVYWLHQADFEPSRDLLRRPRGRSDMPELGIFAQRAKHRPNPIGVTAVELLEVRGPVVLVRGLDAVNGTPVLDLKPYVPAFDRIERAQVPEWMVRLMEGYF